MDDTSMRIAVKCKKCSFTIEGTVADEKGAMDILASVGRRSWNSNGEHLTVHSVIYNLSKKTVYWVPNENYNDPEAWFTFSL